MDRPLAHRSLLSGLRTTALSVALLACAAPAASQQRPVDDDEVAGGGLTSIDEERLYDEIVARLQRESVQLTALVQVVPSVVLEGAAASRFDVPRARLGVRTRLDGGFGARVQAELARSPALLDAYIRYQGGSVVVDAGRHNAPFGFETLTSAASTDFVRRSLAENAVSPGRGLGASARASVGGASLRGGLFNPVFRDPDTGDAPEPTTRGGLLAVGRAQFAAGDDDRDLILGASAGFETEGQGVRDLDGTERTPAGRLLWGADARGHVGRVLLGAEVLGRRLTRDAALEPRTLVGGHVTAGLDLTARQRALARLDALDDVAQLWLGHNVSFTRAASLQTNVVLPLTDGADGAQILLNAQVAF